MRGVTGEAVCIRAAPDLTKLRADLAPVLAAGVTSVAVVLKHAAIFPDHEAAVGALAREMGFKQARATHANWAVCLLLATANLCPCAAKRRRLPAIGRLAPGRGLHRAAQGAAAHPCPPLPGLTVLDAAEYRAMQLSHVSDPAVYTEVLPCPVAAPRCHCRTR